VHTATRFIECNPNIDQFEANWRIELPQGGIVRGRPEDVGTWPDAANDQPPNLRVLQLSNVGAGVVLADNRTQIDAQLTQYNDSVMTGAAGAAGSAGVGGSAGAGGSAAAVNSGGARIEDGGCSFGVGLPSSRLVGWGSTALLLGLIGLRTRRAHPRRE
jgi:hypothetical protein